MATRTTSADASFESPRPPAFKRRLRTKSPSWHLIASQAGETIDTSSQSQPAPDAAGEAPGEHTLPASATPASSSSTAPVVWSNLPAPAANVLDLTDEAEAFRSSVCGDTASVPGHGHNQKKRKKATASLDEKPAPVAHDGPVPLVPYSPPVQARTPPTSTTAPRATTDGASQGATEEDSSIEERWFLGMGTKIVGVQHYDGVVSDRESVVLRRQPSNPYDRNAIQVLNVRNEQIGHIPREVAAMLAPLMDQRARDTNQDLEDLRFEGNIPRGAGNTFSIPLRLAIFGHDPAGRLAPRLRDLGNRLQRTYCMATRGGVEVHTSPDASGTPVADLDDTAWRQITGVATPSRAQRTPGPSITDILERELEGIFRDGGGMRYEDAPEATPPGGLRTELYPHQRKALHWMLMQERGLTVDEALAEAATAPSVPASSSSRRRASSAQTQVFFWTKETLKNGGHVYKNLATNSAFRTAPRLPRGGILADDMGLGKTITALALMLSDAPQERSTAATTAGRPRGKNLVVCPLSVLFNWAEQIRLHAPSLRMRVYHGADRDRQPERFASHDVTITTFDTVRAEAKDTQRGLGAVAWHRVVLDEAHTIKNHRTATAQAVFEIIHADRRWCLTGTPIQNAVEDLYSLARFLRLEPFDRQDWFNRTIVRPLKACDVVGFERLQVLLRTWCLRRTKDMKIRDGQTGAPRSLLMLPQKSLEVVRVPLDPGDRVLYDRLFNCASERVKQLEESSQLGQQFTQVLALLTRLRQLSCAVSLLPEALLSELKSGKGDSARVFDAAVAALGSARVDELLKNLSAAQEDDCCICLSSGCDVVTRCGHVFHRSCVEAAIKELGKGGHGACPLCRQPIKKAELLEKPEALDVTEEANSGTSGASPEAGAKVRSVVNFLLENVIDKSDQYLGKPHKAIVFSQFTSVLNIVQKEMEHRKLPFVRLDGSLSHDKRVQALQAFTGHGHVQVILCSLKAAGTGINLTAADHVLLIDPWWNPAVEDQAIDRAHRLGQRRPVRVLRYVAERTVEERILGVHDQKRSIMEGALSQKSRDELQKMRLQMVASLFEPFA